MGGVVIIPRNGRRVVDRLSCHGCRAVVVQGDALRSTCCCDLPVLGLGVIRPRRHQRSCVSVLSACTRGKIIGQVAVASLFALGTLIKPNEFDEYPGTLAISFARPTAMTLWALRASAWASPYYLIWTNLIITAWSNATNLTDGLDSLAQASRLRFRRVRSSPLPAHQACTQLGAKTRRTALDARPARPGDLLRRTDRYCLRAFLRWNASPAPDLHMGDTGALSLSVEKTVAGLSILTQTAAAPCIVVGGIIQIAVVSPTSSDPGVFRPLASASLPWLLPPLQAARVEGSDDRYPLLADRCDHRGGRRRACSTRVGVPSMSRFALLSSSAGSGKSLGRGRWRFCSRATGRCVPSMRGGRSLFFDSVAGVDVHVDDDPEALARAIVEANLDLVVVSPGIPTTPPGILGLRDRRHRGVGAGWRLAWRLGEGPHAGRPWLVVTGTNGKTTVRHARRDPAARGRIRPKVGNIGTPITRAVGALTPKMLRGGAVQLPALHGTHRLAPGVDLPERGC